MPTCMIIQCTVAPIEMYMSLLFVISGERHLVLVHWSLDSIEEIHRVLGERVDLFERIISYDSSWKDAAQAILSSYFPEVSRQCIND